MQKESMSQGALDILNERERQIFSEGWGPYHDNQHTDGSLVQVAIAYAGSAIGIPRYQWPQSWDTKWDKRKRHDRRRKLVIAGALIAAEIDRLDMAKACAEAKAKP